LRGTLARNRRQSPLFRTEAFTRHLEDAYAEMQRRREAGDGVANFRVG
jgi:predicted O-linked N-acetylglucosamine transferase (SPINDLY family)